jgi:3-vinyl bacteriochlorophyllide hydratase
MNAPDRTERHETDRHVAAAGAIYTPAQRARRDATRWTLVQGLLAPVQFLAFLVSLVLVCRYLLTGAGYEAATLSILIKTALLLTIMVTGSIWEKVVFDRWLMAPAFFWEDVVSFGVIALHLAYLWMLWDGGFGAGAEMACALAAYAAYVVNAAQFLRKLRLARLAPSDASTSEAPA